jgi:hypothetical protein
VNYVPRLPQILPAKVAAAEFALILSMMPGAIIATAFRVAVIHVRVKSFAGGVFELFVSHRAKRHATHNGSAMPLFFTRLLIAQNRVILLSADFGAFEADELVVGGVFNNHSMNSLVELI